MPLPLPNLDTRRWADLVEEGRALIPRYAPGWTDHNVHDPGITLIELLAWLVEQDIYCVNRVTAHHRRKFLNMVGAIPRPPQPARAVLSFSTPSDDPVELPGGVVLAAAGAQGAPLRFRTVVPLSVLPIRLRTVQVFDGQRFQDQTRPWEEGSPFPLLGRDPQPADVPERQAAFYLGFERESEEPVTAGTRLHLWFQFAGGRSGLGERRRILEEARKAEETCRPLGICWPDGPDRKSPPKTAPLLHHAARTVWDYHDGYGWRALDAEAVMDDTRNLTLDGRVVITLPEAISEARYRLRCRLAVGWVDAAPVVRAIGVNTVPVEQTSPVWSSFPIEVGAQLGEGVGGVVPGEKRALCVVLDEEGVITDLRCVDDPMAPKVRVLECQVPGDQTPGRLTATVVLLGRGTGQPGQQVTLPEVSVAEGQLALWTATADGLETWRRRPDLDASSRTDADFTLDLVSGAVAFGDGEHGRVVPAGAPIFARYDATLGAGGNLKAGVSWEVQGADDTFNRGLLSGERWEQVRQLRVSSNRLPATVGSGQEDGESAASRAAATLWAHEQLVELCPKGGCSTLDQLDRTEILARVAPARATTLLDYERLALEVPGTDLRRVRARGGMDPRYPGLKAPGTVTLVVLPALPRSHPQPSAGLIRLVYGYLHRRAVLGTRLVVVGPQYLKVAARARIRAKAPADRERLRGDAQVALDRFLDPLEGGPGGRGWPFGRDVYRSEILQVIDGVPGVDHVLDLELVPGDQPAQCGNLCIGPTWLPTPGEHDLEIV